MTNTSASGGYLAPSVATPPVEDLDLDAIFQDMVVNLTGLSGLLVRPRWQPTIPKQPEASVNWCAVSVNTTDTDANPTITHNGSDNGGLGSSTESRTEYLEVMTSFYGPAARSYAATLRDGLGIMQNRDVLRAQGIAFVDTDPIVFVGELVNQQWIRRADMTINLRRMVSRTYAIQNVTSLQGTLVADSGSLAGQATITSPIATGL